MRWIFIILIIGLICGCITSPHTTNETASIETTDTSIPETDPVITEDKLKQCSIDEDCIAVIPYCSSSCGTGGITETINSMYQEYWEKRIYDNCRDMGGAPSISGHRSCYSIPRCINNSCVLVDHCDTDEDCSRTYLKKLNCVNGHCVLT